MIATKNKFVRRQLIDRWYGMKYRCENPDGNSYHRYGGRGITICSEWKEFGEFYEWSIANGYSKELQLDRIDNDKGYSPDNCRWVTASENSYNRRTAVLVEVKGESYRIPDLAKEVGICESTLRSRYRKGLRGNDLISAVSKA